MNKPEKERFKQDNKKISFSDNESMPASKALAIMNEKNYKFARGFR